MRPAVQDGRTRDRSATGAANGHTSAVVHAAGLGAAASASAASARQQRLAPPPLSAAWEALYVGPSYIRLPIRLATALQPANWCAEAPEFTSCLDAAAGGARSGGAARHRRGASASAAAAVPAAAAAGGPASRPKRRLATSSSSSSSSSSSAEDDAESGGRGAAGAAGRSARATSRRGRSGAGSSSSGSSDADVAMGGGGSSDECIIIDVDVGADGAVVGAETALEAAIDAGSSSSSSSSSSSVGDGRGRRGTTGGAESLRRRDALGRGASGTGGVAMRGGSAALAAAAASAGSAATAAAAAAAARESESLLLGELHAAAVSIDLHGAPVRGDSWLTSTLIDAVTFELARAYPAVHFLPTNVLAFELPHAAKTGRLAAYSCTDLAGRRVALRPTDEPPPPPPLLQPPPAAAGAAWVTGPPPPGYRPPSFASPSRTLITFWNQGQLHWNLIRVQLGGHKSIEVFEPMGRPQHRAGAGASGYASEGLSLRSVPHALVEWLDTTSPLATAGGWRARTYSAIPKQHQSNGFDCGVACLLYAEKCGQGREKEDVSEGTTQGDISAYRELLKRYLEGCAAEAASGSSGAAPAAARRTSRR